MSLNKVIIVAAAALSLASAGQVRARDSAVTYGDVAAQCGTGQVVSCCNKGSGGNDAGSGLGGIGSIVDGLLGGSCSQLSIPVIAVDVPFNNACGDNTAACCTAGEDGLANVACNPINVL